MDRHTKDGITSIRSLLIEDGHVRRNITILFPCVCLCTCPPWTLKFSVRVLTFLSLILCYSYFGTFLSTWSLWIIKNTKIHLPEMHMAVQKLNFFSTALRFHSKWNYISLMNIEVTKIMSTLMQHHFYSVFMWIFSWL